MFGVPLPYVNSIILSTFGLLYLFRLTCIDPANPEYRPSGVVLAKSVLVAMGAVFLALFADVNGNPNLASLAGSFAVGSVVTTAIVPPVVYTADQVPNTFDRFWEGLMGGIRGSIMKTLAVGSISWFGNMLGWGASVFTISLYLAGFGLVFRSFNTELFRENRARDGSLLPLAVVGGIIWIALSGPLLERVTSYETDYMLLASMAAFWLGSLLNS